MPSTGNYTYVHLGDGSNYVAISASIESILPQKRRGLPNGDTDIVVKLKIMTCSRKPNKHAPNQLTVDAYLQNQDEIQKIATAALTLVQTEYPGEGWNIYGPCWQDNNELHFTVCRV